MERWKINLYTLWVTQIFSLMGFGLVIPFIPFYFQELGVTGAQLNFYVGLASTIPAATMAVAAPVWGMVSDRYGRKMMILRAMVAASIILVVMGFSPSVGFFLFMRALQGIFTGTITASMAFVSANTPENKMSFALGFMTSSNFLGYSIGPFLGGFLAEWMGYRACFICGGVIMTIGYVLVLLLVKEDKNTYGKRLKAQGEGKERKHLLTKFVISALVLLFIARVTRTIFTPFIPLFVQERLGTLAGAAAYTGVLNGVTGVATAVAALTITRLGDRYDKFKLVFLLTLISLPVAALLIPNYLLFLFIAVYGVYFFIAGSVEPILTSAVSEETDPSMRGALFGIMGTVNSAAMMVSPMIGAAVSVRFSIHAILILVPIFTAVQVVILLVNRRKRQPVKQFAAPQEEGSGAQMGADSEAGPAADPQVQPDAPERAGQQAESAAPQRQQVQGGPGQAELQ